MIGLDDLGEGADTALIHQQEQKVTTNGADLDLLQKHGQYLLADTSPKLRILKQSPYVFDVEELNDAIKFATQLLEILTLDTDIQERQSVAVGNGRIANLKLLPLYSGTANSRLELAEIFGRQATVV